MNTLFRFMEANGMKNEKIESLPASELDHILSTFFFERTQEKWRRVRASNIFQFSAQHKAILKWEEISI